MVRHTGVGFVKYDHQEVCDCVACLIDLEQHHTTDLAQYISPLSLKLSEAFEAVVEEIGCHPYTLERTDETTLLVAISQIKNDYDMSLPEKIDGLRAILNRIDDEMQRVTVEKEEILASINNAGRILQVNISFDKSCTLTELRKGYVELNQQLKARQDQIQSSLSIVSKMWEIMALDPQFPLDPSDLTMDNLSKLEHEKRRLFDLQKERFREMLEDQERQLITLWNELEVPDEERIAVLDGMRSLSAVDTLERQSALIAQLKPIAASQAAIRPKIEKRASLIQRMKEFEVSAADPNRLFGSSFRLCQEERFRKAACPTLVKLEGDLMESLIAYKDRYGCELIYNGRPFRQVLEEEKENRFINDTLFYFTGTTKKDESPPTRPTNKRKI